MRPGRFLLYNSIIFLLIISLISSLGYYFVAHISVTQAADDTTPPKIANVKVLDVTATTSRIVWETDEVSDSMVNYSITKDYGIAREPNFDKKQHEVLLDNLLPNSTYYFRLTSTDGGGNQGISSDFSFTTSIDKKNNIGTTGDEQGNKGTEGTDSGYKGNEGTGSGQSGTTGQDPGQTGTTGEEPGNARQNDIPSDAANGMGPGQNVLVKEILDKVEQLKDQKALEILDQALANQAQDTASELLILLDNAHVEVGIDYAIISWKTSKAADSMVYLATEDQYNVNASEPYRWGEGRPYEEIIDHRVEITGLRPATNYHYQVASRTKLGQTAKSTDSTFRTKSVLPEIYNINISKIEETAATVSWTTNVPTNAIVEYTNLTNKQTRMAGDSNYMTIHSTRITDLIYDTYYSVIIHAENENGDKLVSDPITFLTTRDKLPPVISKVNNESTLYPGADNKVQTIVSWETDENSKCFLNYQQGVASPDGPQATSPEVEYMLKHVQVITNFLPGTVYKYWVNCEDDVGNLGKSMDFTILTPSQEESIIDIILKNFEGTFGWLKTAKM